MRPSIRPTRKSPYVVDELGYIYITGYGAWPDVALLLNSNVKIIFISSDSVTFEKNIRQIDWSGRVNDICRTTRIRSLMPNAMRRHY